VALTKLRKYVSLIPIIAKADLYTDHSIVDLKRRIGEQLSRFTSSIFHEQNIRRIILTPSKFESPYTIFTFSKSTIDMEAAEIYEI
jgi:septin family protein